MSDAVAEFAAICRRFLALGLDDPRPEAARLPALRGVVGDLIGAVERLPAGRDGAENEDHPDAPTYDELWARFAPRHALGYYWNLSEPLNFLDPAHPPEPNLGDAIEDLADIALELGRGLRLAETGRPADAARCWRWSFEAHWGEHAIGLLRVLHLVAIGRGYDDPPDLSATT